MQTKITIRQVVLAVALCLAVGLGFYAFLNLSGRKEAAKMEVENLLPDSGTLVFVINKQAKLPSVFPQQLLPDSGYFRLIQSLTSLGEEHLAKESTLLLSCKGENAVILFNCTQQQYTAWRKQQEENYFAFTPVNLIWNNIPYHVVLTVNDKLLCYTFNKGACIISYSQPLFFEVLDKLKQSETTLLPGIFTALHKSTNKEAYAYCYIQENQDWYGFELIDKEDYNAVMGSIQKNDIPLPWRNSITNRQSVFVTLKQNRVPNTTDALVCFQADSSLFSASSLPVSDPTILSYLKGSACLTYFEAVDSVYYYRSLYIDWPDSTTLLEFNTYLLTANLNEATHYFVKADSCSIAIDLLIYALPKQVELNTLTKSAPIQLNYFALYSKGILLSDSPYALIEYVKQLSCIDKYPDKEVELFTFLENKQSKQATFSLIASHKGLSEHPYFRNDFLPEIFQSNTTRLFFLQLIPDDQIIMYTGRLY